jgi:septum formation protein
MNQIRLDCRVQAPLSEEKSKSGELPKKMVARLAQEKAESVKEIVIRNYGDSLIISADTIVVAPDGKTILGKPKDMKDARAMLKLLAGKTHSVYTGYCICRVTTSVKSKKARTFVRVVRSRVKMRKLTAQVIRRYVDTKEPMDKAGSYGAQGLGMALVERIEGSYTNVVGLPMAEVVADLEKFNVKIFTWLK